MRVVISIEEAYTRQKLIAAFQRYPHLFTLDIQPPHDHVANDTVIPVRNEPTWFWAEYELLDWHRLIQCNQQQHIMNAYCIRKGLIRKAQLALNIHKYLSKYPASILKRRVPESHVLSVDHVDYLDEALNECFEVELELKRNAEMKKEQDRKRFILKPSLANKGVGIHLFDSRSELESLLQMYQDQADAETDHEDAACVGTCWREWVIQTYIHPPYLIQDRKFHIRAYMLLTGRCKAYMYTDMLALFARDPYAAFQQDKTHRAAHLTNTCLLPESSEDETVVYVRALRETVDPERYARWVDDMCTTMHAVMEATVSEVTSFQPRENAFEIYGLDFVVDANETVWFLEANAFPDFKQTGDRLGALIQGLFHGCVDVVRRDVLKQHVEEPHMMDLFQLIYDRNTSSMKQ